MRPTANTAQIAVSFAIPACRVRSADEGGPARDPRRGLVAGATVLAPGLARDRLRRALLVAPRLPRPAARAAPAPPQLLGLRRPRSHGHARGRGQSGPGSHPRLRAALPRPVPDPADASRRRLPRERRAVA